MKVWKVSREMFSRLGICLIDDQTNRCKQLLHYLFGWSVLLFLGSTLVSSLVCVINYGKSDLNEALYAAFPGIGSLRVCVCLISMIVFRQKVTSVFKTLQKFNDQSKLIPIKTSNKPSISIDFFSFRFFLHFQMKYPSLVSFLKRLMSYLTEFSNLQRLISRYHV